MNIDVLQVRVLEDEIVATTIAVYCICSSVTEIETKTENTIIKCNCKRGYLVQKIADEFFGQPYTEAIDRKLFPGNYAKNYNHTQTFK